MIDAKKQDMDLVVDILLNTFSDNKSVYAIAPPVRGEKPIRSLMRYAFEMCLLFGRVVISEDRKGCALLIYPDQKKLTFRSLWLDLRLVFNGIGLRKGIKAMLREAKVSARQPKNVPLAYLWFIGVYPDFQDQGIGGKLLSELILLADKERRLVCLETSTLQNLPWYGNFGFKVYDKLDLGYELYFLQRELN